MAASQWVGDTPAKIQGAPANSILAISSVTGPANTGVPATSKTTTNSRSRTMLAAGGCGTALLVIVCLLAGAAWLGSQFWNGSTQAAAQDLEATQTVVAQTRIALVTAVSAATGTAGAKAILPTPTPTLELPTSTPLPTATLDPGQPSPLSPDMPYVLITGVTLDSENYVVNYETLAFVESLSGQHIHFFFNTTPLEDAGVPGKGPYLMHIGPRPFRGATLIAKPPEATQICALVANIDHTVIPDSGNCYDLPVP